MVVATVAAALLATPAAAEPSAPAKPSSSGIESGVQAGLMVQNAASGGCLFAKDNYNVYMDVCSSNSYKRWYFESLGNGYYRIRNEYNGRCLYVPGTTNNTQAKTWNCGSYLDQQWQLVGTYDFQMINRNSGKCLVARVGEGYPVQYTCGTWRDQEWNLL